MSGSSMTPSDEELETLRQRLMILMPIGQEILSSGFDAAMSQGEEISPIAMLVPMGLPMLAEYVKSAEPRQLRALLTSYMPTLRALCAVDWLTSETWDWIQDSIEAIQHGADIKTLWPPSANVFRAEWRDAITADLATREEQQAVSGGEIPPEAR